MSSFQNSGPTRNASSSNTRSSNQDHSDADPPQISAEASRMGDFAYNAAAASFFGGQIPDRGILDDIMVICRLYQISGAMRAIQPLKLPLDDTAALMIGITQTMKSLQLDDAHREEMIRRLGMGRASPITIPDDMAEDPLEHTMDTEQQGAQESWRDGGAVDEIGNGDTEDEARRAQDAMGNEERSSTNDGTESNLLPYGSMSSPSGERISPLQAQATDVPPSANTPPKVVMSVENPVTLSPVTGGGLSTERQSNQPFAQLRATPTSEDPPLPGAQRSEFETRWDWHKAQITWADRNWRHPDSARVGTAGRHGVQEVEEKRVRRRNRWNSQTRAR